MVSHSHGNTCSRGDHLTTLSTDNSLLICGATLAGFGVQPTRRCATTDPHAPHLAIVLFQKYTTFYWTRLSFSPPFGNHAHFKSVVLESGQKLVSSQQSVIIIIINVSSFKLTEIAPSKCDSTLLPSFLLEWSSMSGGRAEPPQNCFLGWDYLGVGSNKLQPHK